MRTRFPHVAHAFSSFSTFRRTSSRNVMVFTAFHKSGLLPEATFALRSGPCGFQGLSVVVIPAAFFCDALHDVGDRLVYHVGRIIKAGVFSGRVYSQALHGRDDIEAVVQAGFPCMVRQSKTVSQAVVELQVDAVRGIGVISMNQDFSGQFH